MRPILEYGNSIWSPLYKRQSVALENVQRRFTKSIPGLENVPYHERLKSIGLPSLKYRRMRGDLIQCYKIFNGIDDLRINDFF